MDPEKIFAQLGFNSLEAEVYVALVKQGPQTAYKIAKHIGKPAANVYKAVEVLAQEGAVEVTEDSIRICKAIPIKAVVQQLQKSYKQKADQAIEALDKIQEERTDEGIFKLQTVESVFQRAHEMLQRTQKIAVIDAFPATLQEIVKDIDALAAKGKEVFVQAYEPVKLNKKVSLVIPAMGPLALQHWQAQQLNIAIDGREILLALFNKDAGELVQATYSNNLYLSCMMYSGIISEHKVHRFSAAGTMEEIDAIKRTQKFFLNSEVPGLDLLFNQYKGK